MKKKILLTTISIAILLLIIVIFIFTHHTNSNNKTLEFYEYQYTIPENWKYELEDISNEKILFLYEKDYNVTINLEYKPEFKQNVKSSANVIEKELKESGKTIKNRNSFQMNDKDVLTFERTDKTSSVTTPEVNYLILYMHAYEDYFYKIHIFDFTNSFNYDRLNSIMDFLDTREKVK